MIDIAGFQRANWHFGSDCIGRTLNECGAAAPLEIGETGCVVEIPTEYYAYGAAAIAGADGTTAGLLPA